MADNLVKLMDETGYRQLINMLISIKSSQQESVEKCISIWQPNTTYQKDKVALVVNDNTYSEYICKATHVSGETFDETYWTLVSCVKFEGYTEEELLAMLNLTEEELQNLQSILNDNEIQTDHAWSSSKVYAELLTVLSESKNFTIAEVAKIVSFSYKVVTSEDEVVDDKAIYLIENTSGTHDMYLLIDGSPSKVGNTSIDLSDYLKKENIVDTFDETTIYADSDKVFSTKATKEALDTKLNKSAIVTTLDETVTDEQVPGALATYNATKDKNMKTYTYLSQLGLSVPCTVSDIFLALPSQSMIIIACGDKTSSVTDVPENYGCLQIAKHSAGRFNIEYNLSAENSVAKNKKWIGQLKGSDGSGIVWDEISYTTKKTCNTAVVIEDYLDSLDQDTNCDILFTNNGNTGELATLLGYKLFCIEHRKRNDVQMYTQVAYYPSIGIVAQRSKDWWTDTWSSWRKIYSTSVADVAKTVITFSDTNFTSDSKCMFSVCNGWCHLIMEVKSLAEISYLWDVITDSTVAIPIPRNTGTTKFCVSTVDGDILVISPQNGVLRVKGASKAGASYYGSITYPVAE